MHSNTLLPALFAMSLAFCVGNGAVAQVGSGDIVHATLVEPNAKTPQVSTQELRQILRDGSAMLLDTRTPAEYDAGHIPGARSLPAAPADAVTAVLQLTNDSRSSPVVLYCNGPFCQASRRLGEQLLAAGFTQVRRYQVGMPVWRALGGPTEMNVKGLARIFGRDQTAVFIDARSREEYARGSLPGAQSLPLDAFAAGAVQQLPLPEDDFNTRVVLFGRDADQARALAEALSKRPWHNVSYVAATYEELRAALR